MTRRVEYAHIESALDDLTYPVLRDDAAADLENVTLVVAEDEANLGVLVSETDSDAFRTPQDLLFELEDAVGVALEDARAPAADTDGDGE
ncbi:hypothetical protein [Haloarchaeobius salinus]|uniref:DUF5789 family protein n=1 Tax=Haloarchaeobius salinus TaxID=1198298 RepID=UPI002108B9C5|nr:hypothetical protein [Haloarchaeobius salinus]